MSGVMWSIFTMLAENQKIDTLLFGSIEDDCHGTILFKFIIIIINIVLGGIILGGTVGIIISGVQILTAGDNPGTIQKAKSRIIDVIIGILAFALMYVVLNFIIPGGVSLDVVIDKSKTCPDTPQLSSTKPEDPTSPEDPTNPPTTGEIEHGVRDFNFCGTMFSVVKIQVDGTKDDGSNSTGLKKFIKDKVWKYNINQSDGKLYNLTGSYSSSNAQDGHCDIVSRNLAYDMYFDTITSDSCSTGRYDRKGGFSTVQGDKKFQKMYDDIMAGKPVVHRVTINSCTNNAQRHYAVVVGVKKGANKTNLSTGDFLVLETFGGVLWNNNANVCGGRRSNNAGDSCSSVKVNRFVYDTYYYAPSSKTGSAKEDCGT